MRTTRDRGPVHRIEVGEWRIATLAAWRRIEAPTWLVALAVHGGWAALTWYYQALPWWLVLPLGAWLTAWHGSLQHEVLHGHPTRSARINGILASVPLGMWLPYPFYRARHLQHHAAAELTHPVSDPESFYLEWSRWGRLGPSTRRILMFNNTLMGRLTLGPALTMFGLARAEFGRLRRGDAESWRAWMGHGLAVAALLAWIVWVCGIPAWAYFAFFVYPGLSLVLLRSFLEHRPSERAAERTVIVEAGPLLSLLYLNNNLHALHHERPEVAWYELPAAYRRERDRLLADNGGYRFAGYREIAQRFLWRAKDSPLHPPWASMPRRRTEPS